MPTKTSKDPWHLRRCKNCKLTYKPIGKDRGNAERSLFCTPKCRQMYHTSGGMNLKRLQEVVTRATIKAVMADEAFIEALADKLRVIQAPSVRSVVDAVRGSTVGIVPSV